MGGLMTRKGIQQGRRGRGGGANDNEEGCKQ